jgi:uncharacterized protein (TIGR03435 family)
MLQRLLEDRFKLAIHRETRELPVLALVAGKSGLKAKASGEASCPAPEAAAQPAGPGNIPCGMIRVSMAPAGAQFEGTRVPMSELVRILAGVLGRPVIDRTGVTEPIEVHLEFTPDAATAGLPAPAGLAGGEPASAAGPAEAGGLSIFTAVEQQLGLKLEASKGPVEVLVIDHVEKPAAN